MNPSAGERVDRDSTCQDRKYGPACCCCNI